MTTKENIINILCNRFFPLFFAAGYRPRFGLQCFILIVIIHWNYTSFKIFISIAHATNNAISKTFYYKSTLENNLKNYIFIISNCIYNNSLICPVQNIDIWQLVHAFVTVKTSYSCTRCQIIIFCTGQIKELLCQQFL